MSYWQVAAGQGARDYSSVFTRFGVMLIGSGNPGPYFENRDYYRGRRDWQVVHFAEHVAPDNDIVILKRAYHRLWQIQAIGRVTGSYEYLEQFEDVEGWDLQHCRRVEWVSPRERELTEGLSRGTFSRVHSSQAIEKAARVLDQGIK